MYCPRCNESFSPFQSLCPNCFGELRSPGKGQAPGKAAEQLLTLGFEDLETLAHALETQPLPTMPEIGDLGDLLGTTLERPAEAARAGAERAVEKGRETARRVGEPLRQVAREAGAGRVSLEALQAARHDIMQALEDAARDLQAMAQASREEVLGELRKEGSDARARASELLRSRQLWIEREVGKRLENVRKRYGSIAQDLDPGTRSAIRGRLETLQADSQEVLGGLEKQMGGLPGPLREVARRTLAGEEAPARDFSLGDAVQPSVQQVQSGCNTVLAVFLSFVVPGLGQLVLGQWVAGGALIVLYLFAKGAFPDLTFLTWLLSGLAAWHAMTGSRS